MNQDQFMGIIRVIVPSVVGWAVGKGWIPIGSSADIGAGIIALALAGWSFFANRDSAKIKAVAALPEVSKILVSPTALPTSAAAQAAIDASQTKVTKG